VLDEIGGVADDAGHKIFPAVRFTSRQLWPADTGDLSPIAKVPETFTT